MMESCLNNKADRQEQGEVKDLKSLSSEYVTLPETQPSSIEEREHLQVYLRIRPFTLGERQNGESQDCVIIEPPDTVLLKPPALSLSVRLSTDKSLPQTGQRFQFSQVYGPETTQRELFEGTVKDLVKDVLEGGNSLVFTYGVTNAGKTYTFLGPDADAGILPRSLDVIFGSIGEQVFSGMDIKPHRCREFTRLTREQQVEEVTFKRNLFRQLKESEKSNVSLLNSTNRTFLEGSSMLGLGTTVAAEDKVSLEVETHTKFSVWVSFCEIYNENIHDLLELAPTGALRRIALRLSQDVKGNAFVKDLRWVQVNSAEEAYKVMKLGKKNQSFSATRLNQLSSRSHSIFSIRILRIEGIGTQRVHTVSELCLCDLAGSERCAKTQNKGERLKEAGNINTSLLILGKCINALRHNQQQAKLLQHVPFRESKLTHYLQGFFCGRGKACMIVNINQCASMYDETINVLKFSAVAQKVVVLSTRPLPVTLQRSTSDVSFISNTERKTLQGSKRSSLIGWETSLEDVQEDENDEYEEETSLMEDTMDQTGYEEDDNENGNKIVISKKSHEAQVALLTQLQVQLKKERAESLLIEARIREEISREFSELFSEMQNDYNERLAREREILEERAERRLEIFKNLIDKMAKATPSQDAQAMNKSLDYSSEWADLKKAAEAAHNCLCSQEDKTGSVEELERKVLGLSEHQHKVQTHKDKDDAGVTDDEESSSSEREQLQEALAAFEKEKKAREDTLAALEYQTLGKEDALASLEEERKAKMEAIATLEELKRSKEEALASLEEERKGKEKCLAALEAERRAKGDAIAVLAEEKKSRDEALAALGEERSRKEEAQATLVVERKENSRLIKESEKRQQEAEALQQQVREMTSKLEAKEHQVTSEKERADQALVQLQSAQAQLDSHSKEIQEKTTEINKLMREAQGLKQELQTCGGSSDQLREKLSELRKNLADEKEKCESKHREILQLEHELQQAKELLAHKQQAFDQQLEQFTEKLNQQKTASKQQGEHSFFSAEELKKKLQEQENMLQQPLIELRSKLEYQEQTVKEEVEQLKAKLKEQTQASDKQIEELNKKLQEQEVTSQLQLEELNLKLSEQKETSDKLLDELKQKLNEQMKTAELLKTELEESKLDSNRSSNSAAEDLKKLNYDLQAEVASLRAKVSSMEEIRENCKTEVQQASSEMERTLKEQNKQVEEKLVELEKASAEREAELQNKLLEKEAMVKSLRKSLQEAQEQQEEKESRAVQEARRIEVERRRELLAVAHEAIAQKDAELEKKAEEISKLKENVKHDAEKVKSLSLDLQRKEEDSSDLKEKMADYKKQIQQIQKEISNMREEEKTLRQKLADMEKAKKQLQLDLANRDRSIQQLRSEQSSDTKSDQTLQLYQKACKDLEAKERVMEDMRLALTEQEETQEQMEQVLEEKLNLIQELSGEVEKLKGILVQQDRGNMHHQVDSPSDDLKLAKETAAQSIESLKLCTEKHQAERKKWLEEKLYLISQAKEAEDKRNQEMRKFAEDRERYTRQQSQLESLSSQLEKKEQTMETWRKERDTLVAALEIQLKKLLSSQAEKDNLIQQLHQNSSQQPQEGGYGVAVAELQSVLSERDAEILRLKEELKALTDKREETVTQTKSNEMPVTLVGKHPNVNINRKSGRRRDTRASVSSQGSAGCPSVLDSSEISTENGRTSRFPQPELEISFSPLQPNRMALRRQGEENAVTVKITRSARKRKSGEMEKEEVEAENRRNTRTKVTPKLTPHQEEISSPAGRHDSQSSIRSKKEGTLQKIGDFLQSSPTLLGTKAKKMMSLVSSRADADSAASSSSFSLRAKKNKRKLYRPEISSPMDMPSHPIISREPEEKQSDHQILKRRLRSRIVK
ncbi:kinesin-like protein KIF20B isoform X2 [Anabas testudineus]|uniref:kinesin-like protein KIF20B isoform X2 n=1 Tax=Anabas testudineus TaxID=64144 RepID=UPI000E457A66|nr:kinesin-like protein KIF20B isoform X2 [Anabas testudineus]